MSAFQCGVLATVAIGFVVLTYGFDRQERGLRPSLRYVVGGTLMMIISVLFFYWVSA